jgi:hypothetical protein
MRFEDDELKHQRALWSAVESLAPGAWLTEDEADDYVADRLPSPRLSIVEALLEKTPAFRDRLVKLREEFRAAGRELAASAATADPAATALVARICAGVPVEPPAEDAPGARSPAGRRGTLLAPAPSRLDPTAEQRLNELLGEAAPPARTQRVLQALGEWGGHERTVGNIRPFVRGDAEEGVFDAACEALGRLGGLEAARLLVVAARLPLPAPRRTHALACLDALVAASAGAVLRKRLNSDEIDAVKIGLSDLALGRMEAPPEIVSRAQASLAAFRRWEENLNAR